MKSLVNVGGMYFENTSSEMTKKQILVITFYSLGILIVLSFLLICPFDDLADLPSKGFKRESIMQLPEFLRPMYKGNPNFITLISYVFFTLCAFLFLKGKKGWERFISITSFMLLFMMFICL